MTHRDPYISTTEIQEPVSPKSPVQGYYNSPDTKAEARRLGAVLLAIPFLDMVGFLIRALFALFWASLVYFFVMGLVLMMALAVMPGLKMAIVRLFYGM